MVDPKFKAHIEELGLLNAETTHWNLTPSELIEETLRIGEGFLTDTGALAIDTGKFTGRAPKDRFIVEDDLTRDSVWWGKINQPFDGDKFELIFKKLTDNMKGRTLYARDAYVCADEDYRMNVRVVNTKPWQNLFVSNMFLRFTDEELAKKPEPAFTIFCDPEFEVDPEVYGTRSRNFALIDMTRRVICIGGTAYTGEMKKGIFGVLNYILPHEKGILSMHCSANVGPQGDTAVFFGLSGTGKTTLSADPNRYLVGDDEHGWADSSVFNFEGGCYAKAIDLTEEKEPDIFRAVKYGALLENVRCFPGTRTVNYEDVSVTQNTRVSYPIGHIDNALEPSIGGIPKNIFFLTCDAYGVLPPISKLTPGQAMYHFISGYTAKVAGTELGVTEPQSVFSACFGEPFMPLHPAKYAELLGKKMQESNVNVWLVNTGWTGGPYGVGERIKLRFTRAMISAALEGKLDHVAYKKHTIFGVMMPLTCPDVPTQVLSPRATWGDDEGFYKKANFLAQQFIDNFKKFEDGANEEIMAGAPTLNMEYA